MCRRKWTELCSGDSVCLSCVQAFLTALKALINLQSRRDRRKDLSNTIQTPLRIMSEKDKGSGTTGNAGDDGKAEEAIQVDARDPNLAASLSSGREAQARRGAAPGSTSSTGNQGSGQG